MRRHVRSVAVATVAVAGLVLVVSQPAQANRRDVSGSTISAYESQESGDGLGGSAKFSSAPAEEPMLDEEIAEAVTAATEAGEPVEIPSSITPTARLLALPDGAVQLESSTVPVRTQVEDEWVPISTELVLRNGWWEPTASATPVRFSAGGTDAVDQVQAPDGEWLTETWPGGTLPAPVVDGPTATYPEVYPGVDLRLTATELGMASVYIVKSPEAAKNPKLAELKVEIEGVEIVREESGVFTAENANGHALTASSPLWWDSSGGGDAVGPGDREPAMPVAHSHEDNGITLDVAETVEGDRPTYPIFIDPDWSTGPNAAWYTDAGWPNQSYLSAGASDVLRMGRYSNMRGNAFFEFNIAALKGTQILDAQLSMTQVAVAASPNNPVQLRTFGYQNAGFTWNQQNHNLWGPVIGTQSPGYWGGPAVAVGWDVKSAIAERVGQDRIQFGLAPQDENAQSRRHFSRSATLTIKYNRPPDRPSDPKFVTPATSCGSAAAPRYLSATSVTVSVNQTDPDPENVDVNFNLYKSSDLANRVQWRNPGLGAQGTKTVTFTDLVDGQAYAWNARGSDWKIDGVGSTDFCYFTIDRTGPSAPTFSGPSKAATVGVASAVTIQTKLADRVPFIAYAMVPSAASTSFVFPYFGSAPPCGSRQGTVRIVCPDSSGAAIVSVVPTDSVSRLLAVSYDVAGNPAVIPGTPAGKPGSIGASVQVTAANSPAVSFEAGHVWLTQSQSSPLGSSIPDTNVSNPSLINLGLDVARGKTANPRAPSVPIPKSVLEFSAELPSGLVEYSDYIPGRTQRLFLSKQPSAAASKAIYICRDGSSPWIYGVATKAVCDQLLSYPTLELIGYAWTEDAPGPQISSVGLCSPYIPPAYEPEMDEYRFYAALEDDCPPGGNWQEGDFGRLIGGLATTESEKGVLSVVKSFTVAAWLKPGAGGDAAAISASTSTDGFELGATGSEWRFCLRPSSASPVCATAARPANADWTHLSGVWDAASGEIRLYIRGSFAGSAAFAWPAGTSTAVKGVYFGGIQYVRSRQGKWTGMIADPAIFEGVATPAQLGTLSDGNDPAFG